MENKSRGEELLDRLCTMTPPTDPSKGPTPEEFHIVQELADWFCKDLNGEEQRRVFFIMNNRSVLLMMVASFLNMITDGRIGDVQGQVPGNGGRPDNVAKKPTGWGDRRN